MSLSILKALKKDRIRCEKLGPIIFSVNTIQKMMINRVLKNSLQRLLSSKFYLFSFFPIYSYIFFSLFDSQYLGCDKKNKKIIVAITPVKSYVYTKKLYSKSFVSPTFYVHSLNLCPIFRLFLLILFVGSYITHTNKDKN